MTDPLTSRPPPPPFRASRVLHRERIGVGDPGVSPAIDLDRSRSSRRPAHRRRPAFAKLEFQGLVAVFLLLASTWAFLRLWWAVGAGSVESFDTTVLLALRSRVDANDPIGPPWLQELGRDMTALGGVGVIVGVTLLTVGLLGMSGRRRTAALVMLAIVGATAVSLLLKRSFDRPRPDLVPHGSLVYTSSFPSGHAMLAAVTYLTIGAVIMRMARGAALRCFVLLAAVVVTLAVGVSRVYLGVHWPSDVLGGWIAGAGWACFVWLAVRFLQRRGTLEPSSDRIVLPEGG